MYAYAICAISGINWKSISGIWDNLFENPTMTDLNSLMIFAKVVEANSFSEAARRLSMPTSTVSRRIAEFEAQLGVRLLERSTRRLRLTDVGVGSSRARSAERRTQ
jgi:Bacterial regulatory helix-turn-helix protein, lysR family